AVTREIYSDAEAEAIANDPDKAADLLVRDEDVLDTWFSSGLWPMSTLGWPEEDNDLAARYPTDVLVTGFDIIFFWVARMMMFGLQFQNKVPFRHVYLHALVRDDKGAKMSKSKGNVIDPLQLIDSYGADALRFTLAAMAAQGRDIKLATSRVEGYRNFATKLWNAARFAEMNECRGRIGFDPTKAGEILNRWIIGEAARAAAEVETALTQYKFNEAAQAAYRFVWNIFCDWHLELAKPLLQGPDGPAKTETRDTIAFVLDQTCKMLHPFMPFLTEEIWTIRGQDFPRESMLVLALWPDLKGLEDEEAEAEVGWVVDVVSQVRSVRAEMNVPAGAQIPLALVGASGADSGRAARWAETIKRLARLSAIDATPKAPPQSVQVVARGTALALPLEGVIDFAAERARLEKGVAAEQKEIGKIDAKLGNADFLRRAPEEVVEEQQERRDAAVARLEKMAAALKMLG
ncbi:class I tRNA ligase family protein, partial [Rhodoblastus sp.]|uniref:class I tRNA ligase family protein n=1 Tax=Rhodoblastus sp. TaxID=1962975 RepID=UPI0035B1184B